MKETKAQNIVHFAIGKGTIVRNLINCRINRKIPIKGTITLKLKSSKTILITKKENTGNSSNFCFNSKTNTDHDLNECIIPFFSVENNFKNEIVKVNQRQTTDLNTYIIDTSCTRHVPSTLEKLLKIT